MPERYYLDACIWRDYFENRSDRFRPLGDWAFSLITKIIKEEHSLIYSDLVEEELLTAFSEKEVKEIISIVPDGVLIKVNSSPEQLKKAIEFSKKFKIHLKDALHAVLAQENQAVLVTRDKHFSELTSEITIKKPEELI